MKKSFLFIALAACLGFASSAAASNYLTAKGGIFFPAAGGLNDGYNIELAYGLDTSYMMPNSAVEIGLGYYNASRRQNELSVLPVTATFLLNNDPAGPLNVYGGAGVGVYFSDLETRDIDDSDVNLGLHFLAGVDFPLSPNISFGPELKYVVAGKHDRFRVGGFFLNVGAKLRF